MTAPRASTAWAGALYPSDAPDEDTVEDLDLDLDDDDEDDQDVGEPGEGAAPQARVEFHADQVAVFARLYLRQLEEGSEPDRATRLLTYSAARNAALMFEAARQARAQLLARHCDDTWAQPLEEREQSRRRSPGRTKRHCRTSTSRSRPPPLPSPGWTRRRRWTRRSGWAARTWRSR